jgi:DNA-binding CsgD family transcriptional regulator
MDHLLIVPLTQHVPEKLLGSLRQAGWRITIVTDVTRAKQLLQNGDIAGVIMEFGSVQNDPDRLKILRYVHEFCPSVVITMLHSGVEGQLQAGKRDFTNVTSAMDQICMDATPRASLDLYKLSPAQKRIAELVAQAYPNREIARKLQIKEQSVRNELSRVFKKMGVWNRVELALLMRKNAAFVPAPENDVPGDQVLSSNPAWATEIKSPAETKMSGSPFAMQ